MNESMGGGVYRSLQTSQASGILILEELNYHDLWNLTIPQAIRTRKIEDAGLVKP